MQPRSVRSSSWCVDTDRLGYPATGQQERHHPVGIEERTLISRILTDSAGRNIISTTRARISAGRRGEGKTPMYLCSSWVGQHSTRYTSYTYSSKHKRNHAAPALLGYHFKTTRVQIQTPGSPVVVAAGSRGVVVQRDNISPAHPGNKRKGSALRQGMGAAIQEKEKGGVTHCKDPLLTAKKRGPLTYHR